MEDNQDTKSEKPPTSGDSSTVLRLAPISVSQDTKPKLPRNRQEAEAIGLKPWKPGQSGNPSGRKRGTRNQLAQSFIADLYEDWGEHGKQALADTRKNRPQDYLKVVAAILPKEIKVSLETMSDEELQRRINELTETLGITINAKVIK